jgi:DNA-binding NtrC family response regulator
MEPTVPNVVVVDPMFDSYKALAASARLGKLNLHFYSSGAEALKFARRRRVDAWMVGAELEDMSGNDFVELLHSRFGDCKAAIVTESAAAVGTARDAMESGAGVVFSRPITFRDLEVLLGLAPSDRPALPVAKAVQAFVTFPVGVGAALMAIGFLMLS